MPKVTTSAAPARRRVGLPIVPDGSSTSPLLLRLSHRDPGELAGACNNGCDPCVTRPIEDSDADFDVEVAGRHVVIRHRESTLRRDLVQHVSRLRSRGAAHVALVTNGRMLVYEELVRALIRAGVDRFIVKLFGADRGSHDAHTRTPGSFEQALAGIRTARALGAEVLCTFPVHDDRSRSEREALAGMARELTGRDPIAMPEPLVSSHANEFRYDVVLLEQATRHRFWVEDNFFPMVHLHTGPVCNIRCTYCNVHGGDDQRMYDREYIERLIDDAAERIATTCSNGTPTADFIGGEPTLHPDLPALIAQARKAGFRKVYICTNGVRLANDGYLDRLIAAGLTGVRFSFHDHRPEVANQLADVAGLGDVYVTVAKLLLSRRDVHTHIYRIILRRTIDALCDYVQFLHDHNHSGRPVDLTFGMPSMRGRLFENRHLYPELSGLREQVMAALRLARERGIEPLIHHAPACLVPEEPERSACLHVTTAQMDALSGSLSMMNFEGDARYGAACERCAARTAGCHGVPRAYFDEDSEAAEAWIRPISESAIAQARA